MMRPISWIRAGISQSGLDADGEPKERGARGLYLREGEARLELSLILVGSWAMRLADG